jgi:hypothetical protein
MNRLNSVFYLILCITVGVTCIASVQAGIGKVFSLPEENGNIILPDNASYFESDTNYYYDTYTGLEIHVWYISMFTTGSGDTNLYASAKNCNLTFNSYKQTTAPIETQFMYNVTTSIDCTVVGDGVARINLSSFDGSNLAVYMDGVPRQEGDGWNIAGGYIALQGPANVTMHSSAEYFWPPRDAPHDEFFWLKVLLIVAAVGFLAVAAVAVYLRRRHKPRENQNFNPNKPQTMRFFGL